MYKILCTDTRVFIRIIFVLYSFYIRFIRLIFVLFLLLLYGLAGAVFITEEISMKKFITLPKEMQYKEPRPF